MSTSSVVDRQDKMRARDVDKVARGVSKLLGLLINRKNRKWMGFPLSIHVLFLYMSARSNKINYEKVKKQLINGMKMLIHIVI